MIRVACRLTRDYDTSPATAALPIWAPTPEKMQAAIERIVTAAQPTRIILFGSRARGAADDRSDVDLLVSEAEFEERAEQPGTVERAACKEGRGRAAYPTETSSWVT